MEPEKQPEDHGKRFASWTFPEFVDFHRSVRWYVLWSIVIAALVFYAFWTKNYLFVVIIALITFIYIVRLQRKPRLIVFSITEDGLEVHESFYTYRDIKKFWIIYQPPEVKSLYIEFKNGLRPALNIPLESQNPVVIREVLLKFIPEDLSKEEEQFSDHLQRRLKI